MTKAQYVFNKYSRAGMIYHSIGEGEQNNSDKTALNKVEILRDGKSQTDNSYTGFDDYKLNNESGYKNMKYRMTDADLSISRKKKAKEDFHNYHNVLQREGVLPGTEINPDNPSYDKIKASGEAGGMKYMPGRKPIIANNMKNNNIDIT